MLHKSQIKKRRATIPYSPKLLTKYRARPSLFKSHEELEFEDFVRQPKFHAIPLNTKIFTKTYGIPRYERKLLTIPRSPKLTKKKSKYSIQNGKIIFNNTHDNDNFSSKSNNYSFNSVLYKNKLSFITPTKCTPFRLPGEEISKKKILEFREKLQREQEESEKLRHFVAQPIPNKKESIKSLKNIPGFIPLVQPVPFNLITEKRGAQYQNDFKDSIKQKREKEDKLRNFVAKPPISLFKIPFTISKSNKPLTEFKEIKFETEIRAKEWVKYEKHLKEKGKEIEKLKKEQENYKKLCEKQWLKEQRKKTIFHANPIPSFIYKNIKKER